jgi:hypothetical protein
MRKLSLSAQLKKDERAWFRKMARQGRLLSTPPMQKFLKPAYRVPPVQRGDNDDIEQRSARSS